MATINPEDYGLLPNDNWMGATYQPPAYAAPAQPTPPPPPTPVAPKTPPLKALTPDEWRNLIMNDPTYKQGMEWATDDYNTAVKRYGEMAALDEKRFQQALGAIGAGGGYTVPKSFYEQLELQRQRAAHDKALADEALPFILGARGMRESGQLGFEQGELAYDYDTLLKEIELTKRSREDEVAQANARQAAADAAQRANMMLSRQIDLKQDEYRRQDLDRDYARQKGELLMAAAARQSDYKFDPQTGMYVPV